MTSRLETNRDGRITAAPAEVQWLQAAVAAEGSKPGLRRFQMTAYTGGPMQLGGWRYPMVIDLAGLKATAKPKVFLEHDRTARVGHIDQVETTDKSLAVAGVISGSGQAAREVLADAANGFPWQASIGARATEVEWVPEGSTAQANGQVFQGPLNIARKSVLGEVSFVALGADDATSALIAANAAQIKEPPVMDDPKTSNPATTETPASSTTVTAAAPTTSATPAATTVPMAASAATVAPSAVEQIRAEAAAETRRIASVRKICAGKGVGAEIEAQAIAEGWDATRTELEVLRASRPTAPNIIASAADGTTGAVLEAACLLSAKAANLEKVYDDKTLQAASVRFRGGIGLQELLLEAALANGYTGRNFRDSKAVMRFAFQPDMCGGFSTVDIGGILSNVANKFLLEGFFASWLNDTVIPVAALDGDKATAGSQGLWADFLVTGFVKKEPLNEPQSVAITIKPAYSAVAPEWIKVTAGA